MDFFFKLLVSELTRRNAGGGKKCVSWGRGGVEAERVGARWRGADGKDERCVVDRDSIRGVKANRTEQRGHRCAAGWPACRQAAAQTALSARPSCIPHHLPCRTGLLHPPGPAAPRKTQIFTVELCTIYFYSLIRWICWITEKPTVQTLVLSPKPLLVSEAFRVWFRCPRPSTMISLPLLSLPLPLFLPCHTATPPHTHYPNPPRRPSRISCGWALTSQVIY